MLQGIKDPGKCGSPIAYRNLFEQKGNSGALLLLAAWSSLEGLTCLIPGKVTLVLLVGVVLDVLICLSIFWFVIKSRFSEQRKYVYMLLVWNVLEAVFLISPSSVTAIIICFRAVIDTVINMLIIFMAYYRPQRVSFIPVQDQDNAASQAELLSGQFDVKDDGKVIPPAERVVLSTSQVRYNTVPKEVRLRQAPERTEAGAAPDKDIGAMSFEQLQAALNPMVNIADGKDTFVPVVAEYSTEDGPAIVQPVSEPKNTRSLLGTPAGINTLSEFLTDEEFVNYTAASRLLEANTIWRGTLSDSVKAEAVYEKAMELEPHCILLRPAFNELRDLVTTRRTQPNAQINYFSRALLDSVYSTYKGKLGDKEM